MQGTGGVQRDEELALFHDMHKKERDKKSNAIHPLPQDDADQPCFAGPPSTPLQKKNNQGDGVFTSGLVKHGDNDLLTTELGKNDYDWLLTPPGTPLLNRTSCNPVTSGGEFLSQEDLLSSMRSLAAIRTSRFSSSKSELRTKKEPLMGTAFLGRPDPVTRKVQNGLYTSSAVTGGSPGMQNDSKRPSTPGSRSSLRPTSPTKQPTIASSHTSAWHSTSTIRSKASTAWGSLSNTSLPSRPSTPTSRPKASPTHGSHPSTPTSRSTFAGRTITSLGHSAQSASSIAATKTVSPSRPMTPVRRPATPQAQSQHASAATTRTPSVSKGRPMPSRSAPSSRGSSPTARTVESSPEPPRLRLSLTSSPTVNSRVLPTTGFLLRPGTTPATVTTPQLSSARSELSPSIAGRKTCSPSFIRSKGASCTPSKVNRQGSASLMLSKNSLELDKSPGDVGFRGNKTLEKMIHHGRSLGSSSSPEVTLSVMQTKHLIIKSASPASNRSDHGGLGRNGLRRSLDLDMQQMNLCHRTATRPRSPASCMRNASPVLGTRHAAKDARVNGCSIATNGIMSLDDHIMMLPDCENGGDQGQEYFITADQVPPSDLLSCLVEDSRSNNWLGSPGTEYMDDGSELLQAFQQGIDRYQSCESPLVCPHGGEGPASCDLCNVKMRLQMLSEKCKANFGADTLTVNQA